MSNLVLALLAVSITVLSAAFAPQSNVGLASENLHDSADIFPDSQLWPDRVTVLKDVVGETHGNRVPAGKEWTFLGMRDGQCRVDMGHNGIHLFKTEETDLALRYASALRSQRSSLRLFEHRYTKMFFDPSDLKGLSLGDLSKFETFIILYFDGPLAELAPQIVDFEARLSSSFKSETSQLLIVSVSRLQEGETIADYSKVGISSPIIAPYHRRGFLHTTAHQRSFPISITEVDANGKIINSAPIEEWDIEISAGPIIPVQNEANDL